MTDPGRRHGRVLIADDEKSVREMLRKVLEYENYEPVEAADGPEALEALAGGGFDAMLLDIRMPGMDGMEVLKKVVEEHPEVQVIMISATAPYRRRWRPPNWAPSTSSRSRSTGQDTAHPEECRLGRQAGCRESLAGKRTRQELRARRREEAIRHLKKDIEKLAPTRASILLLGENGVGKGVVARSIHRRSDRAGERFVEVSCAAIPDDLIESELMGHEKARSRGRRCGSRASSSWPTAALYSWTK